MLCRTVNLRTALGFENMQHGIFVKSVRTEAVHRLRRDRQKPSAAQNVRRLRDALFILHRAEGKPFCFQCSLFFLKLRCSRAAFPPAPASGNTVFLRFLLPLCKTAPASHTHDHHTGKLPQGYSCFRYRDEAPHCRCIL